MSVVTRFSLAQYELMVKAGAFDGKHRQRVEFVRGEIREMTPISARHAWAVERLTAWSFENRCRAEAAIRIQSPVRIPWLESVPEPDVVWALRKDYSSEHPTPDDILLLIEVAESSLEYDTGEKAQLYAEAGIGDYWVVNLIDDCLVVFREPQRGGYQKHEVLRADQQVRPLAFPDVVFTPSLLLKRS